MRHTLRQTLLVGLAAALVVSLVPAGLGLDRYLATRLEEAAREDLARAPMVLKDRNAARGDALMMHAREVAGTPGLAQALAAGRDEEAVRLVQGVPPGDESAILVSRTGRSVLGPLPEPEELSRTRERGEGVPILMITGFGTIETAVRSLHTGADDFLTKPVDPDVLSARVGEILERRPGPDAATERVPGMIGRAPAMREVFEAVHRVAPTDATVLLTGETGTGKELVARAIHDLSARSSRPFIPVNCAALAEGVLESELFGHVKGAFTGAVQDRRGLFAAADGGTLLLDEVGDMSLRLQQRLLRVLQEQEVTPVGAARPVPVDARVVAATNRDLKEEMDAGRFREDLFYRLNVFRIHLPPLRERPGDLPLLIEAALDRVRGRMPDPTPITCSPFAARLLRAYSWPGNVREIMAVMESAAIRAPSGRVEAQHLPPEIRDADGSASGRPEVEQARYSASQSAADEAAAIRAALEETGGVRSKAAALLGMSRTTLWRKMKEYRLGDDADPSV